MSWENSFNEFNLHIIEPGGVEVNDSKPLGVSEPTCVKRSWESVLRIKEGMNVLKDNWLTYGVCAFDVVVVLDRMLQLYSRSHPTFNLPQEALPYAHAVDVLPFTIACSFISAWLQM